jgi:polyhydroxyalkanoate synthesis regulator phasin
VKRARRLTDDQARARLTKLVELDAKLTRKIEELTAKRTVARKEAYPLGEQLRGQLELPLASTRPTPAPARATRAA